MKKSKEDQATETAISAVAITLITKGIQMIDGSPKVGGGAVGIGAVLLFLANYYRDVKTDLNAKAIVEELEKLSDSDEQNK